MNEYAKERYELLKSEDRFLDRIKALERSVGHYQARVKAYEKRIGPIPEDKALEYWSSLAQPVVDIMQLNQPARSGDK